MAGARAKSSAQDNRQARPCPDEFEIVFIEQGRLECESYFRARRTTITRWLVEKGKKRLLNLRAKFVAHQRALKRKAKGKGGTIEARQDKRKPDPRLVERAVAHLQRRENGGWVVTACECGEFIVGTRRRSPSEVIELAERKGFNRRRAIEQIKTFAELI